MHFSARRTAFPLSAVLIVAALSTGCATIASGTNQNVSFESEPEGATVRVDGEVIGKTPVSSRLDKESDQSVSFEMPGYRTVTKDLSTKTDPWFFGNILIGGLFGSTTDFASGAAYEYSPDQYFVTLPPDNNGGMLNSQQSVERFIVVTYNELRTAAATPQPASDRTFVNLLEALEISPSNTSRVNDVASTLLQYPNPVDGANAISSRF